MEEYGVRQLAGAVACIISPWTANLTSWLSAVSELHVTGDVTVGGDVTAVSGDVTGDSVLAAATDVAGSGSGW